MPSFIAAGLVVVTNTLVWLVGLGFLVLLMSGDGSRGHGAVLSLYLVGSVASTIGFVVLALRRARALPGGGVGRIVTVAAGGAGSIVAMIVVSVLLAVLLNRRG